MPENSRRISEQKKKSGKGKRMLLILGIAGLAACVGGFCLYRFFFCTPEARLTRGLTLLAKEIQVYGEEWQETGIPELLQNIRQEKSTAIDMRMNVTVPGMKTVGVDYIQNYDGKNRRMDASLLLSIFNITFLEGKMAADAEKMYFSVPGIWDDWYCFNMATFGADYQDSPWAEYLKIEIPKEYSISLFPAKEETQETGKELPDQTKALLEKYIPLFAESTVIETCDNPAEIERAGNTIVCKGVCVTVSREVVNAFLEELAFLSEKDSGAGQQDSGLLKKDVQICFYMDTRGRIVKISAKEPLEFTKEEYKTVDFSFVLSGTAHTTDEIQGCVNIETAVGEFRLQMEYVSENTGMCRETEWHFILDGEHMQKTSLQGACLMDWETLEYTGDSTVSRGEESLSMVWEGSLSDRKEGESMTLYIDKFILGREDKEMVRISGSIDIGLLEKEIPLPPEATSLLEKCN